MSSAYFQDGFTYSERLEVCHKYSDPKWNFAKKQIDTHTHRIISKSAIQIAEVIKAKLDIELFPVVRKIAGKGFDIGGGTMAFSMEDDKGETWCFDMRTSKYKSLKGEYAIIIGEGKSFSERHITRIK